MVISTLIFLASMFLANNLQAQDIRACASSRSCYDGEVCISYTCNKKQVRRCLPRSCYRSGLNCPDSMVCMDKHCKNMACKI